MNSCLPPLLVRSNSAKFVQKNAAHPQISKPRLSQVGASPKVTSETHREQVQKRIEEPGLSHSHRRLNSDTIAKSANSSILKSNILSNRLLEKSTSQRTSSNKTFDEQASKSPTLFKVGISRSKATEIQEKGKKTMKASFPPDFFSNLADFNEASSGKNEVAKKSQRKILYPAMVKPTQKALTAEGSSRKAILVKRQSDGLRAFQEIFEDFQKLNIRDSGASSNQKSVESSTDAGSSWTSKLNLEILESKQEDYPIAFAIDSVLLDESELAKGSALIEFRKTPSLPNESTNSLALFTFYPSGQSDAIKGAEAPRERNSTKVGLKGGDRVPNSLSAGKKVDSKRLNAIGFQTKHNHTTLLNAEKGPVRPLKWFSEKKAGKYEQDGREFRPDRDAQDVTEFSFCNGES